MKKYGIYLTTYGDQIYNMWCDVGKNKLPKFPFTSFDAARFACQTYCDRNPKGHYIVKEIPSE